jgi:hypothetical protein
MACLALERVSEVSCFSLSRALIAAWSRMIASGVAATFPLIRRETWRGEKPDALANSLWRYFRASRIVTAANFLRSFFGRRQTVYELVNLVKIVIAHIIAQQSSHHFTGVEEYG